MTEEQLLKEALKLSKDARMRLSQALEDSCFEFSPKLEKLVTKVAKARLKGILAGERKTVTIREFMSKIRERDSARVEQATDH